jgi:tRNA(Arg) A34 adenosine deaminase TadA
VSNLHETSTSEISRQLLLYQKQKDPSVVDFDFDVAFLIEKKDPATLFFALHSRKDLAPTSAVVRLIQGIYATEPEKSRVLVRNRIYTTASLTMMDRGIIQVAAKRATDRILDEALLDVALGDQKNFEIPERKIDLSETLNGLSTALEYESHPHLTPSAHLVPDVVRDDKAWMALAVRLTHPTQVSRESRAALFLSNRPVAAILVSKTGELLEWALNTNAVNKTLHAELNLVQSFYRKFKSNLPAGSKLFTTLKPCKMCAAMLFDAVEDMRNFEVVYGEDDPGPNARNTALENFQRKLSP